MLLATGYANQMGSSSNYWMASVSGGATSFSTVPQATYLSYSQATGTTYSMAVSFSATSAVNIKVSYTTICTNGYPGMLCTNQTFSSGIVTLERQCPPSTISPPPPPAPFRPRSIVPPYPPPPVPSPAPYPPLLQPPVPPSYPGGRGYACTASPCDTTVSVARSK